jgi:hypothetical protein
MTVEPCRKNAFDGIQSRLLFWPYPDSGVKEKEEKEIP